MEALFGQSLLGKQGPVSCADAFKGKKYCLIYFSAHWCPPCQGFTPKFAAWYNEQKQLRDDFEVVFVSSDRDEEAFTGYYGEMPWIALPYAERSKKDAVSGKFQVNGIPTVIVVDASDGSLITDDGRSGVMTAPNDLPWKPKGFWEILEAGDQSLIQCTGGSSADRCKTIADLKKLDSFALYFSAHWCGPCRAFTPSLAAKYAGAQKKGGEILFLSSDQDQASFDEYTGEMPWVALPLNDSRKAQLSQRFKVRGIPCLITVNAKTGEPINAKARGACDQDADGSEYPWPPKPLPIVCDLVLNDELIDAINKESCVAMNLANVPEGEAEAACVKAFHAAATAVRAKTNKAVAFMKTQAKPKSITLMEKDKCPKGCTLSKCELDSAGCDICGRPANPSMACRECNFDKCMECYEKNAQPAEPTVGLFQRLVGAAEATMPEIPEGEALIMVFNVTTEKATFCTLKPTESTESAAAKIADLYEAL